MAKTFSPLPSEFVPGQPGHAEKLNQLLRVIAELVAELQKEPAPAPAVKAPVRKAATQKA